jgi:Histidine kinase-, DNA gyrase B-, and HSP90-like ATPase
LSISTEQSQPDAVLVAVRDSGPGIDPKDLHRVFEIFYTTKSDGTGMGLSISRSIIEAHGGHLWADLNTPRGAVFQFALPAGKDRGFGQRRKHRERHSRARGAAARPDGGCRAPSSSTLCSLPSAAVRLHAHAAEMTGAR